MGDTTATQALRALFEGIRDEHRMYSNTATRIGNAFLSLLSYLNDDTPYLRKDQEDSTLYLLRLLAGAVIGKDAIKLNADGSIDAKGDINTDGSIKGKSVEVSESVKSSDFQEGDTDGKGVGIYKDGTDWVMEIDRLLVRKIATFLELEIRKLSYTAGNVVIGAAGSRISNVEAVYDDEGNLIGWKCYFVQDDGKTTATTNSWRVNDQARCQTFNTDAGTYSSTGNRYYWRLVTEVGVDYVVLSASVKDDSTDNDSELCIPKKDDTITLVGHQILRDVNDTDNTDGSKYKDRTNLIMLSTTATDSQSVPSIIGYTAITDFDLSNAFKTFTLSPEKVVFHSKYFSWDNTGVSWPTPIYRGDWDSSSTYDYGDEVTYDNCTWICLNSNGATAGETPSESSTVWTLVSGKPGMSTRYFMLIDQSLGGAMAPNETETVTCTIYNGYNEDVTDQFTLYTVKRDTGDESSDAVWNASHTNVGNPFTIAFSDLGIDGINKLLAKFYVTATDEATDAQSTADLDYTA